MAQKIENREGGFIGLIVLIIIAVVLMMHFGVNLGDVINWIVYQIKSVF